MIDWGWFIINAGEESALTGMMEQFQGKKAAYLRYWIKPATIEPYGVQLPAVYQPIMA